MRKNFYRWYPQSLFFPSRIIRFIEWLPLRFITIVSLVTNEPLYVTSPLSNMVAVHTDILDVSVVMVGSACRKHYQREDNVLLFVNISALRTLSDM